MPLNKPILSIILPVYNAEKYIGQAIDSILNQTFTDFELIVADDGSTDASRKIIDSIKDNRLRTSHNLSNQGKTYTVNRLFKETKGQYLTIHDADDWSAPARFEKQLHFLDSNPEYGVCGTGFISVKADGSIFAHTLMNQSNEEILASMEVSSQMHGPTAVVRRSVAEKYICIYRSYFKDNYEDIDFIYRIISQSKGHNLNEYLYYYRLLPNSLSKKRITVRSRVLYKVVVHLMKQRLNFQTDDLDSGRIESVDQFIEQNAKEFIEDASLIHRIAAGYYMFWNFNSKAILECLKGISKKPFKIVNYRTLQYCLRKTMIRT